MPSIEVENDEVWAVLGKKKIKSLFFGHMWDEISITNSRWLSCQVKIRWVSLEFKVDFKDGDINLYLEVCK